MDEFGSYLRDIRRFPDFREEGFAVSALIEKIKRNDSAAKLALIESTLKYVVELAKGHCRQWNAWKNLMDLIQEANMEVSERIEEFDESKGPLRAFIHYRCYIAFVNFWRKSKTVHFTDHGRKILKTLQQAQTEMAKNLGREPTVEELSARIGRDEAQIQILQSQGDGIMVSIQDHEEEDGNRGAVNLDSTRWMEFDPFRSLQATELRQVLIACLDTEKADLLLTSFDGTEAFQKLYRRMYGKDITAAAARKTKERLLKKLIACPEARERFFGGGKHGEF